MTSLEAELRLSDRYDIDTSLTTGDVDAASGDLDAYALVGGKYDVDQDSAFPRSVTIEGDTAGEVPERALDWVALRAYQLATDEGPAVTSEGAGGVSVSYAAPKLSQTEKRMRRLLAPYRASIQIV